MMTRIGMDTPQGVEVYCVRVYMTCTHVHWRGVVSKVRFLIYCILYEIKGIDKKSGYWYQVFEFRARIVIKKQMSSSKVASSKDEDIVMWHNGKDSPRVEDDRTPRKPPEWNTDHFLDEEDPELIQPTDVVRRSSVNLPWLRRISDSTVQNDRTTTSNDPPSSNNNKKIVAAAAPTKFICPQRA